MARQFNNRLLSRLSHDDLAALEPHLEAVDLKTRTTLSRRGRVIDYLYYMESGIASIVATVGTNKLSEIGLVGFEGMTGTAVILNNHKSPYDIFIQHDGAAHRIACKDFREMMAKSESFSAVMLRYVNAFMIQTAQTAVANTHANVDEKLARWLLMARDRVCSTQIRLTHELLSLMLGSTRPTVTVAIQTLQSLEVIEHERGLIRITDEDRLTEIAGVYYGIPEAEYERLFT